VLLLLVALALPLVLVVLLLVVPLLLLLALLLLALLLLALLLLALLLLALLLLVVVLVPAAVVVLAGMTDEQQQRQWRLPATRMAARTTLQRQPSDSSSRSTLTAPESCTSSCWRRWATTSWVNLPLPLGRLAQLRVRVTAVAVSPPPSVMHEQ
jgi:hypothetical protein